ncbi:MAG: 5-formyltetrahydrofolate cyclo-ligase [Gammaproteobacteria bacterium]|nr:5-formyltetrahydrofolate cyclo-ligase [Gammaproteobacteria bacterium]
MDKRQQIRTEMRTKRQQLSLAERESAALQLCHQLDRSRLFNTSQHIALYLTNDGEIDPFYLMQAAWQRAKHCYLPVLAMRPANKLWFIDYQPDTPLCNNRFGIPEPIHQNKQRQFKTRQLDLILMPLVAFDLEGNRLGMGGGFYDRTLSYLKQRRYWHKPKLVGLAYEFQHHSSLPEQYWDVPLDAIATEKAVYIINSR